MTLFAATLVARDALPQAPKAFVDLLKVDPQEGRIVTPPDFDFSRPGVKLQEWRGGRLVYEQAYGDHGCYRLEIDPPKPGETTGRRELRSAHAISVQPNRHYRLSVLVKTDFDRKASEFNVYLRAIGWSRAFTPRHTLGLPAKTEGPDGWQRLEWTITTATDPRIVEAKPSLEFYVREGDRPVQFRIADYTLVELPPRPLEPIPRGEGVTFPGSAGDLPMKVESCSREGDRIVVTTTGARYEFHTRENTVLASQRIEFPRELARWHSSLPFANLRIDRQDDDVCILSNEVLTIGIQRDSLVVFSPQRPLEMTLTNLLGGDFNRYSRGSLYSADDFGGISVDPYTPPGTGLEVQSQLLTRGLSFEKLTSLHALQEAVAAGVEGRPPWSTEKPGAAEPGWQARWSTRPGEFFTTSVFPPRPFEWEKSFTQGRVNFRYFQDPTLDARKHPQVSHWLLWDFIPKMFGHSYSNDYEPGDEKQFRRIVATARGLGIGIMPYMSAYFTPSRDPEVYIEGVRRFKEKYGIDGVYSDGLPSVDWMVAYKEMRMLRDLFPSGFISVHNSISQSGWDVSQQKPFLYTYATSISMGEGVESNSGSDWIYPRYVTSQFRKSNSFGKTLGGKWSAPDGSPMWGEASDLVTLVYNGRNNNISREKAVEAVSNLEKLWKEKGGEPFFYDRYYLPTAQKLTGYRIGRTGMPIAERHTRDGKTMVSLRSLSPDAVIHYTTDGTRPGRNSDRYTGLLALDSGAPLRAVAIAPGLEPSAVMTLENEP